MPLPILGALMPVIGSVLDKVIPDKAEAQRVKSEMAKMYAEGDLKALEADVQLATAQIAVNQKEAEHSSLLVSGWRPSVGWVCVLGLFYQFIAMPLLSWYSAFVSIPVPPPLNTGDLMTLLLGLLGLGGYRTYEKLRGAARSRL